MKKSASSSVSNDETTQVGETSNSSASTPSTTTATSSYEDYLSKIDQRIQTSKNSLKSFDVDKKYAKYDVESIKKQLNIYIECSLKNFRVQSNEISSSSVSNDNNDDESNSSPNSRTTIWNNGRPKAIHQLSDNSVFVNIPTNSSREKHISAALERIRRERDDFDEL